MIRLCNETNGRFHKVPAKYAMGEFKHVKNLIILIRGDLALWEQDAAKMERYILVKTLLHKSVEISMIMEKVLTEEISLQDMR